MSKSEEEKDQGSDDPGIGVVKNQRLLPTANQVDGEIDPSQVIHKGKARLIVSESEPGSTNSTEPRKIRPEPRVVVSSKAKPELVNEPADEVKRLERSVHPGKERIKVGKAKFEKREERLPEDERQEEQWGSALGSSWLMLFLGGGGVIVLVIGLVVMRGVWDGDMMKAEDAVIPALVVEEKDPFEGSPEQWMQHRSGIISGQALQILKQFMEFTDAESKSKLVRHPAEYLQLAPHWPVSIDSVLSNSDHQTWEIGHTEGTAYLILNTMTRDFLPLRIYFTREGETLKLDWQASVAWSDVSLKDIRLAGQQRGGAANEVQRKAGVVPMSKLSPSSKSTIPAKIYTDSVLVRCMIRKKEEHYIGIYNDEEHSAYMLLSSDKMNDLWGYVAKGSDLDLRLKAILDHGSFVVSLKKDERVMLRIRVNEKEALPSQVELVELLNPEWVTP